jgi:hypothetical protein
MAAPCQALGETRDVALQTADFRRIIEALQQDLQRQSSVRRGAPVSL